MTSRPARILIVDDHPNTAAMLARVLSKFDTPVEVLTAQSGERALELIGEDLVDILITDFMMVGMNGLDLIEHLKGDRKPAHTIMMTAYDTPGLKFSADRLRVNDYLVKPVLPEKIRDIVNRVLTEMSPTEIKQSHFIDEPTPSTILIADDNPDNIRLLSVRLQSEGYQFVSAYDGQETLEKIRSVFPDLVLLDVNMPKKDGFEVLVEMRGDQEISHIPVIIVTAARIGAKDIREGLSLGADDYVTKPVDWRELSARIRTKLRVKQAEDNLRRRNKALGILPEVSKDLHENSDIHHLVTMVLERSVEAIGPIDGFLCVFNSESLIAQFIQTASAGYALNQDELQNLIDNDRLIQTVIDYQQGLIVNYPEMDECWSDTFKNSSHSAIIVPLTGKHEVLGLIILTHTSQQFFKSEHLKIIEAIASQASIAIENTRLYFRERKRVDEMVALNQLTHQISHFTRTKELFEAIPGLIRQYLQYPAVSIWQVQEGQALLLKLDGEEHAPRRSLIELAPQQVAQTGQPVQFSGPIEERTGERYGKGQPPIISTIAVPISWNGKLQAVISSISLRPGTFQESDRVLMETISAQIGIVLERINYLESIEQEQKRLAAVLHTAADAILVLSNEGILQIINPAGNKLFTDGAVKVGKPLPDDKGYDGLLNTVEKAKSSGILEKSEIHWPDDRTFSVMVAPIQEGGVVAVFHDVTHFLALNKLKNEFLATASHDLKNPIFSVLGYSDLIERVGSLNEMQTDFLKRIRNSANQMQDLVLNLLEIARIEMGTDLDRDQVNLNSLLQEAVDEYRTIAKYKEHDIQLELMDDAPFVSGDRIRLQQVIRNLLSNAIKYTPNGGQIEVRTHLVNGKVNVEFQDSGIGIPEDAIPHLFQKFFRVYSDATQDIEGNGLGLAIVKSIIDQHGGEVKVVSKEGLGSCFSFSLDPLEK